MVVGKMTKLALSLGMLALATAGTALADGPQTEAGVEGTATGALHSAKTGSSSAWRGRGGNRSWRRSTTRRISTASRSHAPYAQPCG
jgi:hypothetical protein